MPFDKLRVTWHMDIKSETWKLKLMLRLRSATKFINQRFRASGKLLISGEYAVLDGAFAFAIPTKLGQTLEVIYSEKTENPVLVWEAFLHDGSLWFSAEFELKPLSLLKSSDAKFASKLLEIFKAVQQLNPGFFQEQTQNIHCRTQLEFPQNWGLGSSSTLIYLLAKFTDVDEFELNNLTFKTSGYDIACAGVDYPILYQISDGERKMAPVKFYPDFMGKLYFVYLNQKQDTQLSVSKQYKSKPKSEKLVEEISSLTGKIVEVKTLEEFEYCINLHEELLSAHIEIPKVKDLYFPDYEGSVKSLGAWGGDYVLVTARDDFQTYFKSKGYDTIYSFEKLLKV